MKKFISILSFSLALILLAASASFASAAETGKYSQLLILGDSISAGYGLENYTPGGNPYACNSYGNLLAAALGLEGSKTYINRAVNGDRSQELKALLPGVKSIAQKSDLIVISIGGNDILRHIATIASYVSGQTVTGLEGAITALVAAPLSKFEELKTNTALLNTLEKSMQDYASNMESITAMLKEYAPNATVIFLEQYNPMAINGSPIAAMLGEMGQKLQAVSDFATPWLDRINETMRSAAAAKGFMTADVPSVINPDPITLTNITKMDIHPNAAGHRKIFELLSDILGISGTSAETTEHVHAFGDWSASEGLACVAGERTRTCTECGAVEKEPVPAAPHTFEGGKCTVCGEADPDYVETTAEETTAAPAGTTAESTGTGKGCRSAAAAPAILLALAACAVVGRKKH